MREKYLRGANARNSSPEHKARAAERLKKMWADPKWREKMIANSRDKKIRDKAVATRKARGWWLRKRNLQSEVAMT